MTGAPRGSIYHHFPGGKAQLAGEAVDYVGGLAREAIANPLADADPVRALPPSSISGEPTLSAPAIAPGARSRRSR